MSDLLFVMTVQYLMCNPTIAGRSWSTRHKASHWLGVHIPSAGGVKHRRLHLWTPPQQPVAFACAVLDDASAVAPTCSIHAPRADPHWDLRCLWPWAWLAGCGSPGCCLWPCSFWPLPPCLRLERRGCARKSDRPNVIRSAAATGAHRLQGFAHLSFSACLAGLTSLCFSCMQDLWR